MGTLLVLTILMAAVAAILFNLVKNKRAGKSICGGNCGGCPMSGSCHSSKHMTVLEIEGMMCGMCESHINDAIRNNFKVKEVKSFHKTGVTQITSDEPLDENELRKVIKSTGYEIKSIFRR